MAKFKRRSKIITVFGETYVTDLFITQIFYFLTSSEYGRGTNAYLHTKTVNETGHVRGVAIHRNQIGVVEDLIGEEKFERIQNEAQKAIKVKRVRVAGNGQNTKR